MSKSLSRLVIVIGLFAALVCSSALAYEGRLHLPTHATSNVEYELKNELADIDPADVLQVFVGSRDVCCESKSPIAGRYMLVERTVVFEPAFDFIEGQNYAVSVRDNSSTNANGYALKEFTIKHGNNVTSPITNPEVVAIFPGGTEIPENTLRFYIHFSTPMKPNVSGKYIKLLDAAGIPDTAAFMSFKQELWSEDRKRLTLLMDPGRIKRGVAQNVRLGPALLEGNAYSIVIEEGWPTATSEQKKLTRFESAFTVSEALRTAPHPDLWTLKPPRIFTNEPLVIKLDRPFDRELLKRAIAVLDENGRPIQGTISIDNHEKTWRFDQKSVWTNRRLQLAIDTRLEDVAGNNFKELLDHPAATEVQDMNHTIITLELNTLPIPPTANNADWR